MTSIIGVTLICALGLGGGGAICMTASGEGYQRTWLSEMAAMFEEGFVWITDG